MTTIRTVSARRPVRAGFVSAMIAITAFATIAAAPFAAHAAEVSDPVGL